MFRKYNFPEQIQYHIAKKGRTLSESSPFYVHKSRAVPAATDVNSGTEFQQPEG